MVPVNIKVELNELLKRAYCRRENDLAPFIIAPSVTIIGNSFFNSYLKPGEAIVLHQENTPVTPGIYKVVLPPSEPNGMATWICGVALNGLYEAANRNATGNFISQQPQKVQYSLEIYFEHGTRAKVISYAKIWFSEPVNFFETNINIVPVQYPCIIVHVLTSSSITTAWKPEDMHWGEKVFLCFNICIYLWISTEQYHLRITIA